MAISEGLVFNGTDLNDGASYTLYEIDLTPPTKRQEWVQGADADGSALVRDPLVDKRTVTVKLRVPVQATMDTALGTKVGALVDLLEECERQQDGLPLVWTPATGTKSYTLYVLSGEIVGLPIEKNSQNSGYFLKAPMVTLRLDCKPYGYGTEVVAAATVTNSTPVQTLTVPSVTGDVPAEARLIITDAATQSRRHVEWGLEHRYYNAANSLLLDSEALPLVTSGFAGTATTRTGAYTGAGTANHVIRGTLTTSPVAICGVGNLGHIGTYRVKARVYPVIGTGTATDLQVRLSWREGDGPLRSNTYTTCAGGTATFSEVDLGLISIPEKALGTQRWTGQVEAYSTTAGDTLDIDYLVLIPAEEYGKGRAPFTFQTVTTFSARDEFDQTAGVLTAKTLPVGGAWVAGGAAGTDYNVDATTHSAQRTSVIDTAGTPANGRFAIAGTTVFTDCVVQADLTVSPTNGSHVGQRGAVVARYVDASNCLLAQLIAGSTGSWALFSLTAYVAAASVASTSVIFTANIPANTAYTVRIVVDASGRAAAWLFPKGSAAGSPVAYLQDASLATGGTLASGKAGFYDIQPSGNGANTRTFDNFFAAVPTFDAVVYSGRVAEVRFDSATRQDSTGTYYGPINIYRGSRFYLPPAGSAARTSRILVKARRNDVDIARDDQIADSTTATVNYTPRYLVIPR